MWPDRTKHQEGDERNTRRVPLLCAGVARAHAAAVVRIPGRIPGELPQSTGSLSTNAATALHCQHQLRAAARGRQQPHSTHTWSLNAVCQRLHIGVDRHKTDMTIRPMHKTALFQHDTGMVDQGERVVCTGSRGGRSMHRLHSIQSWQTHLTAVVHAEAGCSASVAFLGSPVA